MGMEYKKLLKNKTKTTPSFVILRHQEVFSGLDKAWSSFSLVLQQLLVLHVDFLNIPLNPTLGNETSPGPILLNNFSHRIVDPSSTDPMILSTGFISQEQDQLQHFHLSW